MLSFSHSTAGTHAFFQPQHCQNTCSRSAIALPKHMLLYSHSTARPQHLVVHAALPKHMLSFSHITCFLSATALADHSIWLRIQGCRMAHLDRPYQDWATTVGSVPADAMNLPHHGRIAPGLPANMILFKARGYSELLARPQWDRVGDPCPPPWTPASSSCWGILCLSTCTGFHAESVKQRVSSLPVSMHGLWE